MNFKNRIYPNLTEYARRTRKHTQDGTSLNRQVGPAAQLDPPVIYTEREDTGAVFFFHRENRGAGGK
jgi:hypothetical protein